MPENADKGFCITYRGRFDMGIDGGEFRGASPYHPFSLQGHHYGGDWFFIIGGYLTRNRKVFHPLWIGLIAALIKGCGALAMGIPLFSRAVVNPVIAIITEAGVVSLLYGSGMVLFRLVKYSPERNLR